MKKTYISPAIELEEAQAMQILALSMPISEDTVNGGNALTKENASWDIWGEE